MNNFKPEWLNTYCTVCGKQQYTSPSGDNCENGHGGAPGWEHARPKVITKPTPARAAPITKTKATEVHVKDKQPVFEQEPAQQLTANPFIAGEDPFATPCKVHVEGSVARGRNYGSVRITIALDIPADFAKIREAAEWGAEQIGDFISGEWDNIEVIYNEL